MRTVFTHAAPAPIGPYSQAIHSDPFLFCSGQIGLDPATGELVAGGPAAQAERALTNLSEVLHEAGLELRHVLKTTLYLTRMSDFTVVNEVYARHFGDAKPARSTVAVAELPRGALVEIDAIARD
ncbi:MAG: RidA family protein [Candidatus Eremiobacteraeota bacterium]|nr:RidA family protein [Candidatus Eremiobacteraeota bacterium]